MTRRSTRCVSIEDDRHMRLMRNALAALIAAGVAWPAARAQAQNPASVVVLGTGTPNADPDRFGPAVAIVVNGKPYLVDAGPVVERRAAAAARDGVTGMAVKNLDIAFITHLHSDHAVGLPDLIFTPWVLERTAPLRIYGPPGIVAMTNRLEQADAEDVHVRVDGAEPANETGYKVVAREVKEGEVYRDSNVAVRAF